MHSPCQANKTTNKQSLTTIELNSVERIVKFPDTN